MDKQVNNQKNKQGTPFRKFHSAVLPINLVEKNSDGSVINRRKIHFQINSGKTYHLSYKFFLPKGYHLAKESKPMVPCRLKANGLSVKSLKFVYIKDSDTKSQASSQNTGKSKPVIVNYMNLANKSKVSGGRVYGKLGQTINVLERIPLPSGYSLCNGQSPIFKISDHFQRVGLLVQKSHSFNSSTNSHTDNTFNPLSSSNNVSSVSSSSSSNESINKNSSQDVQSSNVTKSSSSSIVEPKSSAPKSVSVSLAADHRQVTNEEGTPLPFVQDLQTYRNQLADQLLNLVHQRDFPFLRKVVTMLLGKRGNNNISNIQSHPDLHEVSGVACDPQNHTTYVRARNYDYSHPVNVSEVRDFCTCILDNHADRGVFITMSSFTKLAREEAKLHSIVLIDGRKFAHLMIKNQIGVQVKHVYRSFNIDHEFF